MSELSKQALKVDNNQSFPNNNNGAITPSILRAFNTNMIDSTVNQTDFDSFSGSVASQFENITGSSIATGSFATTGSNTFVGNQNISGSIFFPNGAEIRGTAGQQTVIASNNNLSLEGATSMGLTATSNLGLSGSNVFIQNLRYPNFDGTSGQVITTDGAGILTFTTVSGGSINTGSFAITGSNTFTGNQILSNVGDSQFPLQIISGGIEINDPNNDWMIWNSRTNGGLKRSNVADLELLAQSGSLNIRNDAGRVYIEGSTQTLIQGVDFIPFSASLDTRINSITGSGGGGTGATLGANTFTGSQIITSAGGDANLTLSGSGQSNLVFQTPNTFVAARGNFIFNNSGGSGGSGSLSFTATSNSINLASDNGINIVRTSSGGPGSTGASILLNHSGSLVLSNATTQATILGHISSSQASANTNLIFKTNTNTGDTILSGSNNIFINPSVPTAGFKRYIGSNNMLLQGPFVPQISASMQFSPAINGNIGGIYNIRGPISASLMQMNNNVAANGVIQIGIPGQPASNAEKLTGLTSVSNNIVAGTLTLIGNQAEISGTTTINQNNVNGSATVNALQSALTFNNNNVNDSAFVLTNLFFSSSSGIGVVAASRNTISGQANQIFITGSLPAGTTSLTSYSDNFIGGGQNTLFANVAAARVSGSAVYHSAVRNMIFGNSLIVSASSLLADQSSFGSAFFGRWNSIDGTKDLTAETIFAVGTGNSTTRKTGFLIDSGSNTFVEGTLNVSGSTSMTGSLTIQSGSSLFVNGNKQFNVGAFYSTVTQSGSAAVSQSMTFDTTDISQGVSLNAGTQFVIANSGVYNIQFSAQILSDTGADDVWIWLKKNGTNIPNSAGRVTLANNDELMAAWNYVVEAASNDYFELVWQNANGDAVLLYNVGAGNYPAVTSVIATVTQVR